MSVPMGPLRIIACCGVAAALVAATGHSAWLRASGGSDQFSNGRVAQDIELMKDATAALRVCADPNNLPFSNDRLQGFENRLASVIGDELHVNVAYTWWAQRRGYVRQTIDAGLCDVLMGAPVGFDRVLVTRPYYRSSYVVVSKARRAPPIGSLDDPRLKRLRIGVQLIGDDGANTPPAQALAARQLGANVVGYTVYGDYLEANPAARIVDAVARGEVDVAIVWGPLAGYFAARYAPKLAVTAVHPEFDGADRLPLAFSIGVGVSRRLKPLHDRIDRALAHRRGDIERLLTTYHIPWTAEPPPEAER
jgi:mxaJ protein